MSLPTIGRVRSVNVGARRLVDPDEPSSDHTGIFKEPVGDAVRVEVPSAGRSGLADDVICDVKHHGGPEQAVYAYAREDLDVWGERLGRALHDGMFGENLTTEGLNLTDAVLGERWRIGEDRGGENALVLEASCPRIPCANFAVRMAVAGWVKRFTAAGETGTYLRVVTPGKVRVGDTIEVVERPDHGVTIGTYFRAVTTERRRLPELLAAKDYLPTEALEAIERAER